MIEDLLRAVQYEDSDAWQQGIRDLEARWFAPLAAAVRSGRVELDLQSSTIYGLLGWQVRRGDLWRVWQRRQPSAPLPRDWPETRHDPPRAAQCPAAQGMATRTAGVPPLLARLYAARGVESAAELDYELKRCCRRQR